MRFAKGKGLCYISSLFLTRMTRALPLPRSNNTTLVITIISTIIMMLRI